MLHGLAVSSLRIGVGATSIRRMLRAASCAGEGSSGAV